MGVETPPLTFLKHKLVADAAACLNEANVLDVESFVALQDDRLLSMCTDSDVARSVQGRRLHGLMTFLLHGRPDLLEAGRKAMAFRTGCVPRTRLDSYLDRFLAKIPAEQRANIRGILEELPCQSYARRLLGDVCAVAERIPPRDAFIAMDMKTIQNVIGCRNKRRGYLLDAKRQPALDPDGHFASHLHMVRRCTMERNPILWKYPVHQATSGRSRARRNLPVNSPRLSRSTTYRNRTAT